MGGLGAHFHGAGVQSRNWVSDFRVLQCERNHLVLVCLLVDEVLDGDRTCGGILFASNLIIRYSQLESLHCTIAVAIQIETLCIVVHNNDDFCIRVDLAGNLDLNSLHATVQTDTFLVGWVEQNTAEITCSRAYRQPIIQRLNREVFLVKSGN